jgi:hypothetical protein
MTLQAGQTWLLFGLCSLAAVLTGCWTAAASGIAVQPLVLNGIAWTVGAALAVGVTRIGARWTFMLLGLAVAVLLLSLVSAGLSGVHRWFAIGPLCMNAAELVLPLALAASAGLERSSLLRLLLPIAATIVAALQPDASQAVATAVESVVVLLTSNRPALVRVLLALVSGGAVIIAVLRPDPLAPVAQVEGVVLLAVRVSPVVACFGVTCIAGCVAAPLLLARGSRSSVRDAALSLTAYSGLAALAAAVGAFPVPLMGIAVSPILGAWLGLGGLMRVAATPQRRDVG